MTGTVTPAFEINSITFDYEGIPAIRGLSLRIEKGERVALLGANGSGKSTLLRILDGLCFPKTGSVSFAGNPLTPESLQRNGYNLAFRRQVALVFQNPDVQLFNPTVFDEIAYGPLQLRWSKEEVLQHVDETLSLMGISHLKERAPYRLSGGEKKRVALASVLVLDPEVLLLDEPTATLDPRSQSQLVDLIQQWKGTTKTVITATHQLDIVEDIADRVLVLEAGAVVAEGRPAQILSDESLLLRANLVHAHRHTHGNVVHTHPHHHRHSHDEHEH
ncbi:MAG TPA: ABC transporter ATP-binding protein [Candidatus Binatia bacterium]|nr:ABC transporter ATP-binding protein [Candidatus Binatia bacterium]